MAKTGFTMKRKLSSKEIVGDVKKLFHTYMAANKDATRFDLYSIAGVVKRSEQQETPFGQSTRLIGDFLAVSKLTGEMFRSNRVYLPDIMSEELEGAIDPTSKGSVEFAFHVYLIPDDKSATGYVYMAEPVVQARESDQMADLAGKIGLQLTSEAGVDAKQLTDGTVSPASPEKPAPADKKKGKGK